MVAASGLPPKEKEVREIKKSIGIDIGKRKCVTCVVAAIAIRSHAAYINFAFCRILPKPDTLPGAVSGLSSRCGMPVGPVAQSGLGLPLFSPPLCQTTGTPDCTA